MIEMKDDLIAVRALIDTPEKFADVGSVRQACEMACGADTREGRLRAMEVFGAILDQPGTGRGYVTSGDILDRIDRAIAKAEGGKP